MALKTTAQTKEEADEMSVRDRLWDSMNYSYGQKLEQSNASYDKAISQNDRAMLARGMQRSSLSAQTRAGLMNQKIDAEQRIESEKIADYENRLYQIERDEIEDAFKNKQFDEGVRQFNENLDFQKYQAEAEQQRFDIQQAFQEKQWAAQQEQWKQEFDYNKKSDDQKMAYNYVVQIVAQGKTPSSSLLKRAGLSASDAKKMQTSAKSSGGYYKKPASTNPNGTQPAVTDDDLYDTPPGTQAGAQGDTSSLATANASAAAIAKAQADGLKRTQQLKALANAVTSASSSDKGKKTSKK